MPIVDSRVFRTGTGSEWTRVYGGLVNSLY